MVGRGFARHPPHLWSPVPAVRLRAGRTGKKVRRFRTVRDQWGVHVVSFIREKRYCTACHKTTAQVRLEADEVWRCRECGVELRQSKHGPLRTDPGHGPND